MYVLVAYVHEVIVYPAGGEFASEVSFSTSMCRGTFQLEERI